VIGEGGGGRRPCMQMCSKGSLLFLPAQQLQHPQMQRMITIAAIRNTTMTATIKIIVSAVPESQ
jgi:hypothetical protein